MARLTVVFCMMCVLGSFATQRKTVLNLLQEREGRSVARPVSDAAQATFLALDADHSGKVERRELEVFAKAEGLSAEDVASEFGQLDTDGDGELSATEIMGTLEGHGEPVSHAAAPVKAPVVVKGNLTSGSSRQANLHSDSIVSAPRTPTASSQALMVNGLPKQANEVATQPPLTAEATSPYSTDLATGKGSSHIDGEEIQKENVVMQNVKQDAESILAETFARSANLTLQSLRETTVEKKALEMEASARLLRERAESLAEAAQERTSIAASQAASKILEAAKTRLHDLDVQAKDYKLQASRHHQQALAALDRIAISQAEIASMMSV